MNQGNNPWRAFAQDPMVGGNDDEDQPIPIFVPALAGPSIYVTGAGKVGVEVDRLGALRRTKREVARDELEGRLEKVWTYQGLPLIIEYLTAGRAANKEFIDALRGVVDTRQDTYSHQFAENPSYNDMTRLPCPVHPDPHDDTLTRMYNMVSYYRNIARRLGEAVLLHPNVAVCVHFERPYAPCLEPVDSWGVRCGYCREQENAEEELATRLPDAGFLEALELVRQRIRAAPPIEGTSLEDFLAPLGEFTADELARLPVLE